MHRPIELISPSRIGEEPIDGKLDFPVAEAKSSPVMDNAFMNSRNAPPDFHPGNKEFEPAGEPLTSPIPRGSRSLHRIAQVLTVAMSDQSKFHACGGKDWIEYPLSGRACLPPINNFESGQSRRSPVQVFGFRFDGGKVSWMNDGVVHKPAGLPILLLARNHFLSFPQNRRKHRTDLWN